MDSAPAELVELEVRAANAQASIEIERRALVLAERDRWRYLTLGLVLMLFLVSVAMIAGGVLKFRAYPDLDGDTIERAFCCRPERRSPRPRRW